jgi:hypothetical protein
MQSRFGSSRQERHVQSGLDSLGLSLQIRTQVASKRPTSKDSTSSLCPSLFAARSSCQMDPKVECRGDKKCELKEDS